MGEFQLGQKVRIERKPEGRSIECEDFEDLLEEHLAHLYWWIPEMDEYLGRTGVITKAKWDESESELTYCVDFSGQESWYFYAESLTEA